MRIKTRRFQQGPRRCRARHETSLSSSSRLSPFQLSESCWDFDLSVISQVCRGKPTNLPFSLTFLLSCLFPRSLLRTLVGLLVTSAFYQRGVRWSTFHWCCSQLDEHRKWQWLHTYWSPDMSGSIHLTDVNAVTLNLRLLSLLGHELLLISQRLIGLCYS